MRREKINGLDGNDLLSRLYSKLFHSWPIGANYLLDKALHRPFDLCVILLLLGSEYKRNDLSEQRLLLLKKK